MELLARRAADWRVILLDKELKVNARKSNVIVGSSCGKMSLISRKWPCGICGKGVQATLLSAQYVKRGFTCGVLVYVVTCH